MSVAIITIITLTSAGFFHEEGDLVVRWREPLTRGDVVTPRSPPPRSGELATILILFVQSDPVPFYSQLVENKLVLFLLSVAKTTQLFLWWWWWMWRSQGKTNKASFCGEFLYICYPGAVDFTCSFCFLFFIFLSVLTMQETKHHLKILIFHVRLQPFIILYV